MEVGVGWTYLCKGTRVRRAKPMQRDKGMAEQFTPPADLVLLRTADGSHTLWSDALQENYHSVNGAVDEARHVYIAMGFSAMPGKDLRVFEVGLGTGLDLLLTANEAEHSDRTVQYTALEPYPVPAEVINALDHAGTIGRPDLAVDLFNALTMAPGGSMRMGGNVVFSRSECTVQGFVTDQRYDLVYFDAFAPSVQPDMWTDAVFRRVHALLRPGGRMVTYCAKGNVRRLLEQVGFNVERLKGPPGKQHMLRATRTMA